MSPMFLVDPDFGIARGRPERDPHELATCSSEDKRRTTCDWAKLAWWVGALAFCAGCWFGVVELALWIARAT